MSSEIGVVMYVFVVVQVVLESVDVIFNLKEIKIVGHPIWYSHFLSPVYTLLITATFLSLTFSLSGT